LKIKDIMTKSPVTLNPEDGLGKAVQKLMDEDIDGIPVIDADNEIMGLVSKKHILTAYIKGIPPDTPVKGIMATEIDSIREDESVEKAWEYPAGTLPVVDEEGKLVGILTKTNLLMGYYKDLQEVKRLNKELDAIIESSYDGFYITDGNGYTLRINSAYSRITGIKPEEVIGKHMKELVDKGVYSQSVTLLVLKKKKPVTIMHDIKTGKRVLITGNPVFNEKGEIERVVTNVRDITELNRLKKQLEETKELTQRYHMELQELRNKQQELDGIVAKSTEMRKTIEMAEKVAKVDSTVLILGESGVGKEILAKIIHASSRRNNGPFIKVNCAAIPETLLESELFGYEGGSFTGAKKKGKPGMFELARNGTIFLDEIGELPLNLQPKLLRVIQDRELIRVGGSHPVELDVRIIAATNRDLEEMVRKGKFREDLFYRLNVVPITIKPLRERKDDILPLIVHFVERFNKKYQLNKRFASTTVDILMEYTWPGNIRELENMIERLMVMVNDDVIQPHHLPGRIKGTALTINHLLKDDAIIPLKKAVAETEKNLIKKALEKYKTTRKAAKALGIDQSTVVRKAQKYELSKVFDFDAHKR